MALSLLHGAQATRTNVNCFAAFQLYLADVGLPSSVGFTMGVRNVLTEHNALTADTTFCHFSDLLKTCSCQKMVAELIPYFKRQSLYHTFFKKARVFFDFFIIFLSFFQQKHIFFKNFHLPACGHRVPKHFLPSLPVM